MKKYPELSSNDRVIMDLVWKYGEGGTVAIMDELDGKGSWTRHTVKTYLLRLVEKGMLERIELSARKIKYLPLISKEEYLAGDASQYLNENFNGLTHMVSGLVANEMISDDEIDNLERYIKRLKARSKHE